jgi:hypothetical protein
MSERRPVCADCRNERHRLCTTQAWAEDGRPTFCACWAAGHAPDGIEEPYIDEPTDDELPRAERAYERYLYGSDS